MKSPYRIPLDMGSVAELEFSPGLTIVRLLRPWVNGELRIVGEARAVGTVKDDLKLEGDKAVLDMMPMIGKRIHELNIAASKLREAAEWIELNVTGRVGD